MFRAATSTLVAALWIGVPLACVAQPIPAIVLQPEWAMDEIRLRDGRQYRGLIRQVGPEFVQFLHIQRPAGSPMYAVGVTIARADVIKVQKLRDDQRAELEHKLAWLIRRAEISEPAQDIPLTTVPVAGGERLRGESELFVLESGTSEALTRLAIARLEQIFIAFGQLLPPLHQPQRKLEIVLAGTMSEYEALLEAESLPIRNQAFYNAQQARIVAGSDIVRQLEQHTAAAEQVEQLQRQYDELQRSHAERLAAENQRLRAAGTSSAQLRQLNQVTRRQFQTELDNLKRSLETARRQNEQLTEQATNQWLGLLFHEAWHAYADCYLRGPDDPPLPRWLDEGLAQIFETAQVEAGTLRVATADPVRLQRLREALQTPEKGTLADLLKSQESDFLTRQGDHGQTSSRRYLYSWGVTYYLLLERDLLTPAVLREYSARAQQDPLAAFEQLTGHPVEQFEFNWREFVLMRPAGSM